MKRITLNKKGITPIISIILLLMMTIAIAGLAYTWLQKMQSTIQGSSEDRSEALLQNLQVDLRIDGYYLNCSNTSNTILKVYVRNAGDYAANNLQLYLDDIKQTGNQASISSLPAGSSAVLNQSGFSASTLNKTTRTIKVVSDEATAEKTVTMECSSLT